MRQSTLFPKTAKLPPAGETSVNAQLLERAGFIKKHMAGVYSYLPLGVRVLRKVESRIRDAMNAIDGQEVYLSVLQPKELWEKTGRWELLAPVMYQFQDHSNKEVGLGITHEEVIASLLRSGISSYKDLPVSLYQIQSKFRHEARPRSGLLRGREFPMKDLYSCHASQEECDAYYEKVAEAYEKLFASLDLHARRVEASGGDFTKSRNHEFQVPCETGEDRIIACSSCTYAENLEIAKTKAEDPCPQCGKKELRVTNAIEVGHIFTLGTKYAEGVGAFFTDKNGEKKPVVMASYGIGVSRIIATIVEVHHDATGILWPAAVAPFDAHILALPGKDALRHAEALASSLEAAGLEVLLDDRDARAGEKFADSDLIGIPVQCVISERSGDKVELRTRKDSKNAELLTPTAVKKRLLEG